MTDETTAHTQQESIDEGLPADDQNGFTDNQSLQDDNLDDDISDQTIQDDESLPDGEESLQDAEESRSTPKPKPKRPKGVLEYDLSEMYPEIDILIKTSRREWNYNDPDIIRAMWLESKTNVLQEWKVRNARIDKKKEPSVQVLLNHTAQLRLERQKQKEEQRKADFRKHHHMIAMGKLAPHFDTVKMATTTTVEMRYKFNRNNPPIPGYYINHYDRYKKPPFKTKIHVGRRCLPDEMSR